MIATKDSLPVVSVAILDDDHRSCDTIAGCLRAIGCSVRPFTDARKGLESLRTESSTIVITDFRMPDIDGLTILRTLKDKTPSAEVIMVTGHADKELAIQALRLGAFCLLEKPLNLNELVEVVKRTVRYRTALQERDWLAERVSLITDQEAERWGIKSFVGESKAVRKVLKDIRLLQGAAGTSVLIMGESGTGKELVSRAIHFGSSRADKPFVPVNCSAIPSELAESTLFGHQKGAFTGATADRKGCFELANDGTVFLDEIGDMPLPIQSKLLRILEDGVVLPVGGTRGRQVNVRVIAATNVDLNSAIESGEFRSDLFFRLSAFPILIPPLREHVEDIPILALHFVRTLSAEMGISCPALSEEAVVALQQYEFPGNVRELKNMIERALIESMGRVITVEHMHFSDKKVEEKRAEQVETARRLPLNLRQAEAVLVGEAVARAKGNLSEAARSLGVSRAKLYRLLQTGVAGDQVEAGLAGGVSPGSQPHAIAL